MAEYRCVKEIRGKNNLTFFSIEKKMVFYWIYIANTLSLSEKEAWEKLERSLKQQDSEVVSKRKY